MLLPLPLLLLQHPTPHGHHIADEGVVHQLPKAIPGPRVLGQTPLQEADQILDVCWVHTLTPPGPKTLYHLGQLSVPFAVKDLRHVLGLRVEPLRWVAASANHVDGQSQLVDIHFGRCCSLHSGVCGSHWGAVLWGSVECAVEGEVAESTDAVGSAKVNKTGHNTIKGAVGGLDVLVDHALGRREHQQQ